MEYIGPVVLVRYYEPHWVGTGIASTEKEGVATLGRRRSKCVTLWVNGLDPMGNF